MRKQLLSTLFIVILGIGTIIPFFQKRFFNVHDNTQVPRVYEMGVALSNNSFPVRWVPDLGYGYGYPIFNFYGPLPYYVGGITHLVGVDSLMATKIMFVIGILLSGVTMFYFSKRWFGVVGGLVSAVLYMYFPYHAVNIYVRGAVGEFFAYAFLPLLFMGIFSLWEDSNKTNKKIFSAIILVATGIFLTSISHNLSIFMVLVLLVPFVLGVLFFTKKKIRFVTVVIIGLVLGFLLSAFYILPAFLEKDFTNVASQVGGGANFSDHFVCIKQYWSSQWGYGGSIKGCMDGLSFALGKFNIVLFGLVLVAIGFSMKQKKIGQQERIVIIALSLLAFALILTLGISVIVWNAIPLMAYIQYPWRFINFIGLFFAFISGYLAYRAIHLNKKIGVGFSLFIILITIGFNVRIFFPEKTTDHPASYYENKEYLHYEISKISDEYLPSGFAVPKTPSQVPASKIVLLKTAGLVNLETNKPTYQKFNYNIEQDGVFHANTAYFPGWKAYLSGQEVPIVQTVDGMNISVPKGQGVFELKLTQTPIEILGNTFTVLAFLILFTGIIRYYGKATS